MHELLAAANVLETAEQKLARMGEEYRQKAEMETLQDENKELKEQMAVLSERLEFNERSLTAQSQQYQALVQRLKQVGTHACKCNRDSQSAQSHYAISEVLKLLLSYLLLAQLHLPQLFKAIAAL